MKKISIISVCIIALAVFAVWAPNADAYSNYTGNSSCFGCHYFDQGSTAHTIHRNDGPSCSACHNGSSTKNTCAACHALPEIAEYHYDNNFSTCANCHSAAPDPRDVDDDGDGVTENQGDCNDTNRNIYPGAAEICGDGVDQDCNGFDKACPPDPADVDDDGDKITENQGDCDDANPNIFPGAEEICEDGIDQDCDGYDEACPPHPADVDNDGDGVTENQGDCDDGDASIKPGAKEICEDGIDQDCDGSDETCPPDPRDVDDDQDGVTENQGDCDDNDASIKPGAKEICDDGKDQNCDGADEVCPPDPADVDDDNDGFTENQGDCDDTDASRNPSTTEICGDGVDQNCSGADLECVPDPDPNDVDNDGDGVTENAGDCNDADTTIFPGAKEICGDGTDQDCSGSDLACPPNPADVDDDKDGVTENEGDCDDTDETINPGAKEICGDGVDQDCDGADVACPPDPRDVDDDRDGVTENEGDCNDDVASIHPGATELCDDGIDQDCDGFDEICPTDPNDVDNDGDGVTENQGDLVDTDASIFPGAAEVCGDGIDQDCDGSDLMCPPDSDDDDSEVRVEEVEWEARESELDVEGTGAPVGAKVIITDAKTGDMIGTTAVQRNGEWELERDLHDSVPCRVRAEINGQYAEMDVEHAPAMCSDDDDDRDEHDDSDGYERDDDDDDDGRFRRTFRRIRERLSSSDYFTRLFSRWN